MIKVSVVIPVYNGENYLRQCLDSVCNQTLREIEIICVDDGSTDSSYEILQEYKEKDARIQLYQQQNLYAGAARNLGKKHAIGEYLVFWDCDDFFELNALEVMYEKAHRLRADVCVCGVSQYFQDKEKLAPNVGYYLKKKLIPEKEVFNRKENEEYILNFTNEAAWNKMFCRTFIERMKLDFQPVRNGNDVYFVVNAICLAERITTVDLPLINYRKNQKQSLVGTISRSPLTPFQAWVAVAEDLQKKNAFPEKSFVNKAIGSIVYLLRNIREREAFYTAVKYLKDEGLERLHIEMREEGYYYAEWHNECVEHLIQDSIEDFQCYLAFLTYIQMTERIMEKRLISLQNKKKSGIIKDQKKTIKEMQKQINSLKKEKAKYQEQLSDVKRNCEKCEKELDKIRNSWSFKIGKILMWLPGKAKRIYKICRNSGISTRI